MFEAQTLIAKEGSYVVYSPWFQKGGDSARFTIDMVEIDNSQGGVFTVDVLTKKAEDTGDGASIASQGSLSSAGITTFSLTSESTIKELVRYKYTLPVSSAGDWFLFRMVAPVWYDVA